MSLILSERHLEGKFLGRMKFLVVVSCRLISLVSVLLTQLTPPTIRDKKIENIETDI